MTIEQRRHIRQTVKEVCRLLDCRPRDWRGTTVEDMLYDAWRNGARVFFGCFTNTMMAHVL